MNDRIRRKGTRCLTEAAAKIGAKNIHSAKRRLGGPPERWIARSTKILRSCPIRSCNPPSTRKRLRAKRDRRKDFPRPFCAAAHSTIAIPRTYANARRSIAETRHAHHRPRRRGVVHDSHRRRRERLCSRRGTIRAMACGTSWTMNRSRFARCSKRSAERLGAPRPRRVPVWLAKWLAGRTRRGVFHAIDAHNERALPPRFRLGAALSDVSRRPGSNCCRLEEGVGAN